MAKAKKAVLAEPAASQDIIAPRPRLHKLIIKNFRCIGSNPVEIELDDIVVLVGPNNVGKTSILKAYEIVMCEGSKNSNLTIDDFPNKIINDEALPEIELQTIIFDKAPGEQWIIPLDNGEGLVREKWVWASEGAPKRQGFDVKIGDWSTSVPWGAPNVANSRRPEPHIIDAFESPDGQTVEIKKILMQALQDRISSLKNNDEENDYKKILDMIKSFQNKIVEDSTGAISEMQEELTKSFSSVFPNYEVKFDAKPEDISEKSISFFKSDSQLLVGPKDGFCSSIEKQGSGARRTLLWTALRYISETNRAKGLKSGSNSRPHVLLLDEPEICLHPSAIRDACKVLYDLPQNSNWQVMVTTHSPSFIDISRDNTTIVKVERDEHGDIHGTTIFRPAKAKLSGEDKVNLKLLNIYDPYVAEFFFGGKNIIVEGDTEYTAFKYIISKNPEKYKDVHIIRARGKATIVSLVKILNHFGSHYSVLHDSDTPTAKTISKTTGAPKGNPAWGNNKNILAAIQEKPASTTVRLLCSIPNFEGAYLGKEVSTEKPYNALVRIQGEPAKLLIIQQLLDSLISIESPPPEGCCEWDNIDNLKLEVLSKIS